MCVFSRSMRYHSRLFFNMGSSKTATVPTASSSSASRAAVGNRANCVLGSTPIVYSGPVASFIWRTVSTMFHERAFSLWFLNPRR